MQTLDLEGGEITTCHYIILFLLREPKSGEEFCNKG